MIWQSITDFFTRSDPPAKQKRSINPARQMAARLTGGIDGARTDRFGASWAAIPATPDEQIRLHWRILVARSRDLTINDPYMARYVRACRANIVGHGPQLRCMVKKASGKEDRRTNDAVSQSWGEWSQEPALCDVTEQQSLLSLTLSVVHSMAVDGEAFVRLIDGGPYGLQLQLIDAVRCPSDYDVDRTGTGTFIRSGIEFNAYGKPVAYHFTADDGMGDYYGVNGLSYTRVPAEHICHVYRKNMADQKRGLPWATPSLYRLKNLKEFEDNAALNARVGAGKMGIITWDEESGPERPEDAPPISFTAEGGTFAELPAGANLKEFNPAFPDNTYGTFLKTGLRAVSSGMGINYTSLGNDLEGVNFSSIRSGTLEERELFKEDQRLLIEQFMKPVFKRWLAGALLRNAVKDNNGYQVLSDKRTAITRAVSFTPRRWDWVDPKSDAIASQKALESGIKSPQEIIRERGRDPEEVVEETAAWWRLCDEKGVPREALQAAWGEQVKTTITDEEDPDNAAH